MQLYTSPGPCPACHQPADLMGDHALACPRYSDRIVRHNQLRDLLYETAASAALGPVREGCFLLPGTAAKPADVLLPRWSDGKDRALDVTVTSPLCQTNVARAAAEAGSALKSAFERKVQGAAAACYEQGITFSPIAAETLVGGGLHRVAVVQLKRLASALARQSGEDEGIATRQLFQRFSLCLMQGNAQMQVSRSPNGDMLRPEIARTE